MTPRALPMTADREALRQRIVAARDVLEAWEDAEERTRRTLRQVLHAGGPEYLEARKRQRRARNQVEAASNHLQVLQGQWDAARPRETAYSRAS